MNLQPLTDHIGLLKLMQEAGGVNVKPSIDLLEWCKDTIISQNQAYLDKCQEVERLNYKLDCLLLGLDPENRIRNNALEDAAKIAENDDTDCENAEHHVGCGAGFYIATAIRALKDKQ